MKLNQILVRKIFSLFNGTHIITRNKREPSTLMFGWVASTLMKTGNAKVAVSAVHELEIVQTDCVCEVGSGTGLALLEIVKQTSQQVYAIEISKVFRAQLRALDLSQNVFILDNDARKLKGEIGNNSIDKLFGENLVYLLAPLNVYLNKFLRILKPGGMGIFAYKFNKIQGFDETVAPNKSEAAVIEALIQSGFDATRNLIDLGDTNLRYIAIKFHKPLL